MQVAECRKRWKQQEYKQKFGWREILGYAMRSFHQVSPYKWFAIGEVFLFQEYTVLLFLRRLFQKWINSPWASDRKRQDGKESPGLSSFFSWFPERTGATLYRLNITVHCLRRRKLLFGFTSGALQQGFPNVEEMAMRCMKTRVVKSRIVQDQSWPLFQADVDSLIIQAS